MTGPVPLAVWTVPELVSALGTTEGAERDRVRNELVTRARDAVSREEIRAEIHRQTGPLQQEVERTTVAAWRHFRRRAFFDALTAWTRERNRFGATVPNGVRTRLLAQNPPPPEAILFFRAEHERDRLDRAATELHHAQTRALQRLTIACGSHPELFPPQVHALLVRLHREILFDLGEPKRMSGAARALSLDAPPPPRRPPDNARTVRWLAPEAASVDAARAAWRARRNAQLLPMLQEALPREGLPQDLQLHAARPLLDHFDAATRTALVSTPAASPAPQPSALARPGGRRATASTADDAAQRSLDALLLLIARRAAGESSVPPEPRWRNMLHLASRMTPHFERSGIRVPEGASVAIITYAHHKPYAHDVLVNRGTAVDAVAPALLHIPQMLVGDAAGAPREGWFQHAGIGSRTFVSSQFQQLFTYLITGLFAPHPGGWGQQWNERLNSIAEDRREPAAQAQAAELLHELPTRRGIGMAFLQYIRLARARAPILARLPSRHPDVERFLDGFFIVDPVPPASTADRRRTEAVRVTLADLVRVWLGANPPSAAAALFSIITTDPPAQWRRLVNAIFVHMDTPMRTNHWFSAARQKCDFAAFGVVASASAVRRAIEHATATFLAAPSSAFLEEYERYLDAVLPLPARTAPANARQEGAVYEPPPENPPVQAEDLSGLRVRVAHRYDRRDTTPRVSLWVVVDYIHLERATTQPLRDGASSRVVGVSGLSGNAGSPHIHLDLVVTAEEGQYAPAVGYISFFDFFFASPPPTAP